jgi:hypothetical protein
MPRDGLFIAEEFVDLPKSQLWRKLEQRFRCIQEFSDSIQSECIDSKNPSMNGAARILEQRQRVRRKLLNMCDLEFL